MGAGAVVLRVGAVLSGAGFALAGAAAGASLPAPRPASGGGTAVTVAVPASVTGLLGVDGRALAASGAPVTLAPGRHVLSFEPAGDAPVLHQEVLVGERPVTFVLTGPLTDLTFTETFTETFAETFAETFTGPPRHAGTPTTPTKPTSVPPSRP